MRRKRWDEDRVERHGLEEPQVARDFIDGECSGVVLYLFNLGVQLVFISIEFCVLCMGILGLEIYHYKSG